MSACIEYIPQQDRVCVSKQRTACSREDPSGSSDYRVSADLYWPLVESLNLLFNIFLSLNLLSGGTICILSPFFVALHHFSGALARTLLTGWIINFILDAI